MSPLHHDRLLAEGAVPAGQAATTPAPHRSTGTPSTGSREGNAGSQVPPQRPGKTQPARTRKTAGPFLVGPDRAGTGSRHSTRTAQPVDAAAIGRARSGGRHRAETPASARIATARAVVVQAIAAKVATGAPAGPVTPRPTPYRRTAPGVPHARVSPDASPQAPVHAEAAPAPVTAPATDPAGAVPALAAGRAPRRRRSLHLAAALVGALGISGASAGEPAEVRTTTASSAVSVAEELGIEGPTPARGIADADVTSRLGELVVSRNARDAERTAAADAQAEADRLAVAAAEEAARPDVVLPVEGARLTSGFGARWGTLHAGIDLAAPMRTPEYAVMDGVVLEAGPASGFGLAVYIQHHNGDVTVYGHMDEILVEAGQIVRAGDTIALLGNRGQSTGPHLHFEVHVGGLDGEKIDPVPWLRERGAHI